MKSFQNVKFFVEKVYYDYHRPEFIHPDPLETVLIFQDVRDREIAAFVAASFSLGNVQSILNFIYRILREIPSPYRDLVSLSDRDIDRKWGRMYYRFFNGKKITLFFKGLRNMILTCGSLEGCFLKGLKKENGDLPAAQEYFTNEFRSMAGGDLTTLICSPAGGSACKRLNLFLRWMVREDCVDPGGWTSIGPEKLLYPVDIHLLKACRSLGITRRKQADLKAVVEITEAFRVIDPKDPVRFDFSLTRLGIHPGLNRKKLISPGKVRSIVSTSGSPGNLDKTAVLLEQYNC